MEQGENKGLLGSIVVEQDAFRGPFDVLLQLIEDGQLAVDKISISEITEKFVKFVVQSQKVDMDGAAEFLFYCAHLIEKKSKLLLPHDDVLVPPEAIGDLETQLAERLRQYRAFKEIAGDLKARKAIFEKVYARYGKVYEEAHVRSDKIVLKDVSLADLVSAFKKLWDEVAARSSISEIEAEEIRVEDRMREIAELLKAASPRAFSELFPRLTKMMVMATFLAVLELVKLNVLTFQQDGMFGEILVFLKTNGGGEIANQPS